MNDAGPITFRSPLARYARDAEQLLAMLHAGDAEAAWRFKWLHPRFRDKGVEDVQDDHTLGPDDARAVIAHHHGFATWDALATFTDAVQEDGPVARFETAVEAVVDGDADGLRRMLREDPGLARARSSRRHRATLLHYVAANGVEDTRQRTPGNAVEVARILLDAGAEPDALADMYDQQCTTMSMLVSSTHPAERGLQFELAALLLDRGASVDGAGSKWNSAIDTALAFGYLDTARGLAARGVPVRSVATAAGLGRRKDVERLLHDSTPVERHAAMALAAQLGHAEVVALLLVSGEDPDRFNPDGHHAHATPLHHAALGGHMAAVQTLVEHGARLDLEDTVYRGTPLDWAMHGGHEPVAAYLRSRGG